MPGLREDQSRARGVPPPTQDGVSRRSVVPPAAGRSLWLAAIWTGAGTAVLCATVAIVAVAICWLPVSGPAGRSHSAIHAGLLTFLASLHGGVTVDGMSGAFLPLGMMIAVGLAAWRAGAGLADAADEIDERDPLRLAVAGAAQAASFAVTALVIVPFSRLGTSSVPFLGVGLAALLLFAVAGGTALAVYSPLSDRCVQQLPPLAGRAARGAAAVLAVYLAAGALLVLASVVVHRGSVETLSRQVGGGWGGVPILLLGVLAAPNAVIAGTSYLAGPGFAVGSGTTANAFSTAHGTLPAFPILGAVPDGHGANAFVWLLMAITPIAAGLSLARLASREDGWADRFAVIGAGAGLVAASMFVLGWQGGGSIGAGRLSAVGASPWQFALAVAGAAGAVACAALGAVAARDSVAARTDRPALVARVPWAGADASETEQAVDGHETGPELLARGSTDEPEDAGGGDKLAG